MRFLSLGGRRRNARAAHRPKVTTVFARPKAALFKPLNDALRLRVCRPNHVGDVAKPARLRFIAKLFEDKASDASPAMRGCGREKDFCIPPVDVHPTKADDFVPGFRAKPPSRDDVTQRKPRVPGVENPGGFRANDARLRLIPARRPGIGNPR